MKLARSTGLCACGCGTPAFERGRYARGHFEVLSAARRRLREARRQANRRGMAYDLDLAYMLTLVQASWPKDDGLALRRVKRNLGYVRGNMELVPFQGGRRRGEGRHRLRRRLERLAERIDLGGRVTAAELGRLFEAQGGRCAVSGLRLSVAPRLRDPDAISVALLDPNGPSNLENLMLVTAGVTHCLRIGMTPLLRLARAIAKTNPRKA